MFRSPASLRPIPCRSSHATCPDQIALSPTLPWSGKSTSAQPFALSAAISSRNTVSSMPWQRDTTSAAVWDCGSGKVAAAGGVEVTQVSFRWRNEVSRSRISRRGSWPMANMIAGNSIRPKTTPATAVSYPPPRRGTRKSIKNRTATAIAAADASAGSTTRAVEAMGMPAWRRSASCCGIIVIHARAT